MRRLPSLSLALVLLVGWLVGLVGPASASPGVATATTSAPTSSTAAPYVNEGFVLRGDIGKGARTVTLQHRTTGWVNGQTVRTKADGTYSFTTHTSATSRDFRVVAPPTTKLPAVGSAAVTVRTRADAVRLVLSRNRSVGIARGTATIAHPGRAWTLQIRAGSWKQVGPRLTEGKHGAVVTAFPLKKGDYRLVGASVAKGWDGKALPGAASVTQSLAAGPKSLGKRVLFLSTSSGATPKDKGKGYAGRVGLNDAPTLVVDQIAVRGNTSASYPKTPYKLKFAEPQAPFGLPRGKTFILVPNYQDHALVRNAVATELARKLDGLRWTPHRVFTEVFLNGRYRGSYELIESIKIQQQSPKNDARVPIDEQTGVVVEINPSDVDDAPGLYTGRHGMTYAFKDPDEKKLVNGKPDPEGLTPAKVAGMKKKIATFESVLYGKSYKDKDKGWQRYLDLDSAVDFYLENEFVKNWDGDFFRSTFFFTPSYADPKAKLFMGPIWDEDRTAAARTTGTNPVLSPQGWWMNGTGVSHTGKRGSVHKTHWFVRIAQDPAFQKALRARWAEERGTFKAVGETQVDAAVAQLGKNVAANDRAVWQSSNPSYRNLPRAKTYGGEVAFVRKWYEERYKWMNDRLG